MRLRQPPKPIEPAISDKQWEQLSRDSGLSSKGDREWLDELIAIYRTNRPYELTPRASPKDVRRDLKAVAKQAKSLEKNLLKLESDSDLVEAIAADIEPGGLGNKPKIDADDLSRIREQLSFLHCSLERASDAVPRGKSGRKADVLQELLHILHLVLHAHSGEGLSQRQRVRNFAVRLFQITDPKLPDSTIEIAVKESSRGVRRGPEYLESVSPGLTSVYPWEWDDGSN
ncbi:hypothetical protein RA307_22485 [Xanthobacteraceae bacterium Astr-EGSB]|uniref:hypothetical protein n=1 Tax=Astrobacterium formosum TaxID=3069710 RepID=UPI0027AED4B5|nr:hypothetical protein [Xanthobacteraceae bacterium Astr-EGSB]